MRLEIGFPVSDSHEFIRSEHFMMTKVGIMRGYRTIFEMDNALIVCEKYDKLL